MQLNMKEFRLRPTQYLEEIVDELILTKRGKLYVRITKYAPQSKKVAKCAPEVAIDEPLQKRTFSIHDMITKKKK